MRKYRAGAEKAVEGVNLGTVLNEEGISSQERALIGLTLNDHRSWRQQLAFSQHFQV
jgi:hypothetical protein